VAELGVTGHEWTPSVIVLAVLLRIFLHGMNAVAFSKRYPAYIKKNLELSK